MTRATSMRLGLWAASLLSFFALWHVLGTTDRFFYLAQPTDVFASIVSELAAGTLISALLDTLTIAVIGLVAAGVVGVTVGIVMGVSRRWHTVLDPIVKGAFSTPLVMFVPVIAIYAGLEFRAKVIFVFLFCVFIVIINTASGIREVPEEAIEMARAFEVSNVRLFSRVIVPWASPYVMTGLRLAVGRSIQGAVIADLFLRAEGIGYYIVTVAGRFQLDRLLGAVMVLTLLGAGAMALTRALENRLLRWKEA